MKFNIDVIEYIRNCERLYKIKGINIEKSYCIVFDNIIDKDKEDEEIRQKRLLQDTVKNSRQEILSQLYLDRKLQFLDSSGNELGPPSLGCSIDEDGSDELCGAKYDLSISSRRISKKGNSCNHSSMSSFDCKKLKSIGSSQSLDPYFYEVDEPSRNKKPRLNN